MFTTWNVHEAQLGLHTFLNIIRSIRSIYIQSDVKDKGSSVR